MPLIGCKLHVLNALSRKKKSRDSEQPEEPEPDLPYVVPETSEICSSEQEVVRKTTIYREKIWTCRVTGKSNLTYRDAVKTEANACRILRKTFPKFFEKCILEQIHLSSSPLEAIVHACWTLIHEQFHLTEPVKLKVDSVSSTPIHGIIDEIIKLEDTNAQETTSPNSSDKENLAKRNSPIKKNYAYSIKVLTDVPVVVHDVPACSIDRINKVPSKDHIRMFIRCNAMRYGPNFSGPWIVNGEALRRYKISSKNPAYQVDKAKLKQMSDALEEEFFARIINARRQSNADGTSDETILPVNLKRYKRFSVLREDNSANDLEDDLPLSCFKNRNFSTNSLTPEENRKKMRQATLFQFGKKDAIKAEQQADAVPVNTRPKKSLPRVAQHLLKMYNENRENPAIAGQISICARFLSDADILKLPPDLSDLLRTKKDKFAFRKKLMSMSPNQRKEFLKETREKQRIERLNANKPVDDQYLMNSIQNCPALPEPSPVVLPSGFTELSFGRLLGITEFFHSFHGLFLDGGVDDSEVDGQPEFTSSSFVRAPFESQVPGVGEPGYLDDDDPANTDEEEEEAALTESSAPLPTLTVRSLKRLGLQRLLMAVTTELPTAGSYRTLARPLTVLLRLLLKDEQLGKKRELGIKLTKLPVTPYTAPELLRLTLLHKLVNNVQLTATKNIDNTQTSQLVDNLTNGDLHELSPESRLIVLEAAVERVFEYDLIDEHIIACQRRSAEAWQKKIQVLRDRNLKRKDKKDAVNSKKAEQVNESQKDTKPGESVEDLASVVKRRRILAARAAVEKEEKENLERRRRTALAQEYADERAVSTVSRLYDFRSAEARCAMRCQPLGLDRFHRRFWYFRCMPDRLFVESHWTHDIQTTSDVHSSIWGLDHPLEPDSLPDTVHREHLPGSGNVHYWSCWSIYDHPEQLDQLFSTLLHRGVREGQLKNQLQVDGFIESLKNRWMKNTPTDDSTDLKIHRESNMNTPVAVQSNIKYSKLTGTAALAIALLKNILDTEVRLRSGGLGGVPDFVEWQERLAKVQNSFGCSSETSNQGKADSPDKLGLIQALLEVAENIIPRFLNVPDLSKKSTTTGAQMETLCENENHISDDTSSENESDDEAKCGIDDKAILDPALHEVHTKSWLCLWRAEVQRAKTLTRLNLLHACLDACIRWEKSVEDARCRICRRKTDDDNLLLCDGCNLAFHLYCLRPPLKRVPAGDWYCPTCRPSSRALEKQRREERLLRSERRRQRALSSDDDDGDGSFVGSEEKSDSDAAPHSKRCQHGTHTRLKIGGIRRLTSFTSKRTPTSSVQSTICDTKISIKHDDSCLICSESNGDLAQCSTCPNVFHLACHEPPLHHIPRRDAWICSSCRRNRKRISSKKHFQNRQLRRSNYLSYCQKRYDSAEEQTDDEFTTQLHPRRSNRSRTSRLSELRNTENGRHNSNDISSSDSYTSQDYSGRRQGSRRRCASNSANSFSERFNKNAKRRRQRVSIADSASSEDDQTYMEKYTRSSNFYCSQILNAVFKHKHSWPFRQAVNENEVPDYYEIITHPVDLSMLKDWLDSGRYNTDDVNEGLQLLINDLGTMFYNAELYNAADSNIWVAGEQLEKFVKNQFTQLSHLKVCYDRPSLGGF